MGEFVEDCRLRSQEVIRIAKPTGLDLLLLNRSVNLMSL